ncbi:MAG: RecX family transcriptional regulator [Chloroflexota bacterium]
MQKRNQSRVNVFLDGEFAFGLALNPALTLKVGQELSDADIASLQREDDFETAKDRAVRQLARRPYSAAEIDRYLRRHSHDTDSIARVLEYLSEMNYVNDEAFAEFWVEQRDTFRPRSRLALRQELAQKGLSSELITQAVESVDEAAAAQRLAEKQSRRWQHLSEAEFYRKVGGYLQRHGFPYSIVEPVVTEAWQSINDNTDINE